MVSFEQLLLDISEALGFPRWHRARVTRLYTTHAREVRLNRGHVNLLGSPEVKNAQTGLELLLPHYSYTLCDLLNDFHAEMQPGLCFAMMYKTTIIKVLTH